MAALPLQDDFPQRLRAGREALDRGSQATDPQERERSLEEAAAHFRAACALRRDSVAAILGLGRAYLELGRFDQARVEFRRAVAADEDSVEARYWAAIALFQLGQPDEARELLDAATGRDPHFTRAWSAKAMSLRREGRPDEALEVYRRAVEANPSEVPLRLDAGDLFSDLGEFESAVKLYLEAVELAGRGRGERGEADARSGAASAYLELKRYDDALEQTGLLLAQLKAIRGRLEPEPPAIRPALDDEAGALAELDERLAAATYLEGWALLGLRDYDEAVARFEDARDHHPRFAFFGLFAVLAVRFRQGKYGEGWALLDEVASANQRTRAARQDPFALGYVRSYGLALRLLSRGEEAEQYYLDALEKSKDEWHQAAIRTELVVLYLERRDDEPAGAETSYWAARRQFEPLERTLRKAVDTRPNAKNLLLLGSALVLMDQQRAEAKRVLTRAIRLDPRLDFAHANLGLVHSADGDHAKAASCFQAAVDLDRDNLDFQVALAGALSRQGLLDDAEQRYRATLRIAPCNVDALIGLGQVLVLQEGDPGQAERYEEAESVFIRALRLARSTAGPLPALRRGSTSLTRRRSAAVHYSLGYARARRYEEELSRGVFAKSQGPWLEGALDAFEAATDADPTYIIAERAATRIKQEKKRLAPRALGGGFASTLLVVTALVLLVVVQLAFFLEVLRDLRPSEYALLTFGLLTFVIAAVSLPQLLKLRVAGVTLEKTVVEQPLPALLDIRRDRELLKPAPSRGYLSGDTPTPGRGRSGAATGADVLGGLAGEPTQPAAEGVSAVKDDS